MRPGYKFGNLIGHNNKYYDLPNISCSANIAGASHKSKTVFCF